MNKEQIAIIEHAIKNRRFCGDSDDMDWLVENGYMKFLGRNSFVPDGYYAATRKGIKAVGEAGK